MKGLESELRAKLPGTRVGSGSGGVLWVSLLRSHGGGDSWLARLEQNGMGKWELRIRDTPRARTARELTGKTWSQAARLLRTAVQRHLRHELRAAEARASLLRRALHLAGPGTTPDATAQRRAGSGAGNTFDATLRKEVEGLALGVCPQCGDAYSHRPGCPSYFAALGERATRSPSWRP